MRAVARIRSWAKAILGRAGMERDMDAELQFHIESYADDLVRSGVARGEALRRARLEFGGLQDQKEHCRASLGLRLWDELRSDLRYAGRMLRQSPAFTAVAVLSLALGIGANTAIFSLAEAVLLKTLDVQRPGELRLLSWVAGPRPMIHNVWRDWLETPTSYSSTSFSYPVYEQLKQHNEVFDTLFAFKDISQMTATIQGAAEPVLGELVSGNLYNALGVHMIRGRPILPSDDVRTATEPVAVISDGFWKQKFAGSNAVIGRVIRVNGIAVTIVGVNPPGFRGLFSGDAPDVFLPISLQPRVAPNAQGVLLDSNEEYWALVMGRLKRGVSEARARAELDGVFTQAVKATARAKENGDLPHLRLLTGDRGVDRLRKQFSQPTYLLLATAGLVLLIACVNLANLLLARSAARQREMSVRLALGATRSRIVRQVFAESMLLAVIGGTAGALAGFWGRNLIPQLMARSWERNNLTALFDLRVLSFAIALSFATGVLFGVAPAWRTTREDINMGLKETSRSTASRSKALAAKLLIVVQISLSVLLVIGAGLFVRTLLNLKASTIGFEPQHILLFELNPPRSQYPTAKRVPFFRAVEQKVAEIPGLTSVTLASGPLLRNDSSTEDFVPNERLYRAGDAAWRMHIGARFFETMGIPILYGRPIDEQDTAKSQKVAVVNQELVRKFFPKENPIGKTFNKEHIQIVGICGDVKYSNLRAAPPPTFYRPYTQLDDAESMTFEIKTNLHPAGAFQSIRKAVSEIDKAVPVQAARTQTEQIDAILTGERLFATLTTGFGVIALALASIGIYGVKAYTVARRQNEIGIRMALGAQRAQVLASVLREAAWMTGTGLLAGVIAALLVMRLVTSMLYGLKPTDGATLVSAVALLLLVSLAASWIPARRASLVDPMRTLRHE